MKVDKQVWGLAGLMVLLAIGAQSRAAVLFSDSFETPPETVSAAPTKWSVSANVYVVSTKASDGVNSLFLRDGTRSATLSPAVSLNAAPGIVISFDMAQGSNAMESSDVLTMAINYGSGWVNLLSEPGLANGYSGTYAGSSITLDNTTGTSTSFVSYALTIPSSQIPLTATSFQLRFSTVTSTNLEDYYIDNVRVSAIPEPAALAMFALSGVVVLAGRRRSFAL